MARHPTRGGFALPCPYLEEIIRTLSDPIIQNSYNIAHEIREDTGVLSLPYCSRCHLAKQQREPTPEHLRHPDIHSAAGWFHLTSVCYGLIIWEE